MDAFAVSSIEGVVQRAAQLAAKGQARDTQPQTMREIKTETEAICALEEAVEIKINRLLADPAGLNFSAMQDITKALDLIAKMKAKQAQDGDGPKILDAAKLKEIRERYL